MLPRLLSCRAALLLLGAWLAVSPAVRAQEARAVATVAPTAVEVGEEAQFQVQVTGASAATPPEVPRVEGLEIRYAGHQSGQQISIINGSFSRTVTDTHVYQVIPRRAGSFTIPGLAFQVSGRTVRSQSVALRARAAVPQANGSGRGSSTLDTEARAEVVLSKSSVFLGEAVPIELRLQIDSRINWEFEGPPIMDGEGFTKTKPLIQNGEVIQRDGRDYDSRAFKAVITPSRAGTVEVGPAEFMYRAQAPRAERARPRNPFADSFFEDFFNQAARGGFGPVREYKATAEAARLTVKPLPSTGQPADFSGAVGQFQLSLEGGSGRVKMGDPMSLRLVISGTGNFDRVNAPVLKDARGWRTYPPSDSLVPADELGLRATKTFEVAVVAEAKHSTLPVFTFSYFDPETEKYVTLTTPATKLIVEGEPPRPAATPVPAESAGRAAPKPATTPPAPATDILGLRYDLGASRNPAPLSRRPVFLLAQLAPLALLLGWLAVRLFSRRPEQRLVARWRSERESLLAQLQRERAREPFFQTAVRVLQLQGAIRTGQNPETVDVAHLRSLYPTQEAALAEIFEARAALLFAGGAGAGEWADHERDRLLAATREVAKG